MKRRRFLVRAGAVALAVASPRAPAAIAVRDASQLFGEVEETLGGRVGVAAIDTRNGARLVHRGDERFAMCSTFKWLLAAAVLSSAERDPGLLDRAIPFGAGDLLSYAPVTSAHVVEGRMTVRALCEAAVEMSDNTAANLLLKQLGGPQALTQYLRRNGDRTTRLDRFEPELNTNLPGDPRDTTTPAAMAATLQTLLTDRQLADESRLQLIVWLKKCQTGSHRLRAGLPQSWPAGDKTGTGENGAINDVAIAWPPRRPPMVIASYLSGSHATSAALDAAHARIGGIVAAVFAPGLGRR